MSKIGQGVSATTLLWGVCAAMAIGLHGLAGWYLHDRVALSSGAASSDPAAIEIALVSSPEPAAIPQDAVAGAGEATDQAPDDPTPSEPDENIAEPVEAGRPSSLSPEHDADNSEIAKAPQLPEPRRAEAAAETSGSLPALADIPVPTPRPEYRPAMPPAKKQRAPETTKSAQTKTVKKTEKADRTGTKRKSASRSAAKPQTKKGASASKGGSAKPSKRAITNWQSKLLAHLARYKRYPSSARQKRQEGVVTVRFTIDTAGAVKSARLVRSSGVAALDKEAVAMIRRASPVPRPPAGANRTITAPIRFDMR